MSETIRTVGRNGIELTEYRGEYGITACYEGKDGKFYQQWGKTKIGKDAYSDKDRPVKVILGDRKTAIATLNMLLTELDMMPRELGQETSANKPADDVPF